MNEETLGEIEVGLANVRSVTFFRHGKDRWGYHLFLDSGETLISENFATMGCALGMVLMIADARAKQKNGYAKETDVRW